MQISFYKYQGTGNDFIMIDDRGQEFDDSDLQLVSKICDRKFGIGADGLILIRNHTEFDFEMIYFNADGSQSMCGNGARCAVAFSAYLGIINEKTNFLAIDGAHDAILKDGLVELLMGNVAGIEVKGTDSFINTGSPHHIRFVEDVENYPVFDEGKKIRYDQMHSPAGTNVNFVEKLSEDEIFVRTYERGVEDETLSCGTGVTAAAIAFGRDQSVASIKIKTLGGQLSVKFKASVDGGFNEVWLIGPAEQVFAGKINL
ncbi:diaminopimelate epimerase [Algoriphagus ratkowskyi]|uniref:Diaminopimelate epimerase n=1 Tax=Algoriphagus ratkowskyi TaxID=57028 RepID=A0A2W7RGZ7_9BACT|nr:diaminopimelate epimerase [Algoriphagus ratkowskyi]PZX58366.1 diaminopimelate epimerase [Algoriphagus ratkowskyi]TXD77765.1 diaminopimelate epimerase [Algoriphagus ratkowskyi]